jgi:signal transduction histidine kinase
VEEHLPFESELIARIGWLIRLRWFAVAGLLCALGMAAIWLPDILPLVPLLGVTVVIGLYNLLFLFYLGSLRTDPSGTVRLRHATRFACVQISVDLTALAVLIHFSGGVENPIALFFVFHVIIASILLSREISYLMAGLASMLFAAVAGLEFSGAIPHYHLSVIGAELYQEPFYLLLTVIIMTLSLFLVTYLSTSITVQLRARDQDLLESNLTCQIRSTALEELNEQLQRIDQERTRFILLVTHELRAPINTIYSALELALMGIASPEKTQEMLRRAQGRATELLDLIRDLLDLAQAREQAGQQVQAEAIQMSDVLRDVAGFVQIEAKEKNQTLELDIAPDLDLVRILPEQAKLVWTNLLSNAIKYTAVGGEIRVSLTQDEGQVFASVRDSGIGIEPEDLPHIFDEFFRAKNARSASPHGTGVGLAVVRRVIENWDGKIWAASDPGQGSTFTFVLPATST